MWGEGYVSAVGWRSHWIFPGRNGLFRVQYSVKRSYENENISEYFSQFFCFHCKSNLLRGITSDGLYGHEYLLLPMSFSKLKTCGSFRKEYRKLFRFLNCRMHFFHEEPLLGKEHFPAHRKEYNASCIWPLIIKTQVHNTTLFYDIIQ